MIIDEEWARRLAALYLELDETIAQKGWSCRGCGECCHFDVLPHILYASEMEKRYLLLTSAPAANPDGDAGTIAQGKRCPYQENARCVAREGRPLGCRLHFCEAPEHEDTEFFEQWHNRLKTLHKELDYNWLYTPLLPL